MNITVFNELIRDKYAVLNFKIAFHLEKSKTMSSQVHNTMTIQ